MNGVSQALIAIPSSTLLAEHIIEAEREANTLGEAESQALLLARRQATAAMNNALQAQVTALKAYYGLLVDVHLIWNLEHD